jgi:hypothetical protein
MNNHIQQSVFTSLSTCSSRWRVIWVILFLSITPCLNLFSQSVKDTLYADAAVLWRGFTHEWSYNHRLNRLGSYIENPLDFTGFPFTATLCHTSATGLGPDVGTFSGYYSYLAANGVSIQTGKKEIRFSGNLGDMHTASFEVLVDAKKDYTIADQHTVVINGFDILSERRSDKLQMFRLSVTEGNYIPATGQIRFTIDAAFLVRCQSIECSVLSDKFEYTITIAYLIFSASAQHLFASEQSSHRVYNWDKHAETQGALATENNIQGIGNNLYPSAALAFKSINITLDRPHWFISWHSAINPIRYDALQGSYRYELDLLFKQWKSDMKKGSVFPSKSKFSIKRNGWAAIDGTVVMLQLSDGFVLNSHNNGAFKWTGKNQSANSDTAVNTQEIVFDTDVFLKDMKQFRQSRLLDDEKAKQLYQQYISDLAKLKEQRKQERELKKQEKKQ